MTENHKPGTVEWLFLRDLKIEWPRAQRALKKAEAERIAQRFDFDAFGVLTVTAIPGSKSKYHITDGQTRAHAATLFVGHDQKVPCYLAPGGGEVRSAELFGKINTGRSKPLPIEIFRTDVTARLEPQASIMTLIQSLGFRISLERRDGDIRAVLALRTIAERASLVLLRDVLLMVRGVWGMLPEAYHGQILQGVATLLYTHGQAVLLPRLATINRRFNADAFLGAARSIASTRRIGVAEAVYYLLVEEYNRGVRLGRLDIMLPPAKLMKPDPHPCAKAARRPRAPGGVAPEIHK